MTRNKGQIYRYYWSSKEELEEHRITLGVRQLFQNILCLLSPLCRPESGYLGWNLRLGKVPDPAARDHFLNKGLPMTRVHVHVYTDKTVHMVYSKHTDSI